MTNRHMRTQKLLRSRIAIVVKPVVWNVFIMDRTFKKSKTITSRKTSEFGQINGHIHRHWLSAASEYMEVSENRSRTINRLAESESP